jgi:hypothetical protein
VFFFVFRIVASQLDPMELIRIVIHPDEQVFRDASANCQPQLTLELSKFDSFNPEILLNVFVDRADRRCVLAFLFHAADNVAQQLDVAARMNDVGISRVPVRFTQKSDFTFLVS